MIASLAAAAIACTPVPGAAALWQDPAPRFVAVGETHGTNEVPALFTDLVCLASEKRKVVIAVEINERDQPAIDSFMASDGGSAARDAFLAAPLWHAPMQDGRGSVAYLALFERLRQLRAAGRIAGVYAYQPALQLQPGDDVNRAVNAGMARILLRLAERDADALVMSLGGSVHAAKAPKTFGTSTFIPAAGQLPPSQTRSVLIRSDGGVAWTCGSPTACGANAISSARTTHPRGVTSEPVSLLGDASHDFDAVADIGAPSTASPPAADHPEKSKP